MVSVTAALGGRMTMPASPGPPQPSQTLATSIVDVPGSPLGPGDMGGPLGITWETLGDPRGKIRESRKTVPFNTKSWILRHQLRDRTHMPV